MPQRFLRPGITTSERWNALDWFSQSFYIRLITLVDDYGRYEANYMLLKSHAFPITQNISLQTIVSSCEKMHSVGLVVFYTHPVGKNYLQITNWGEKPRSEPKYPMFDDSCKQMFSIDNKCSLPSSSPSSSPSAVLDNQKQLKRTIDISDEEFTMELKRLYPKIDVQAELNKMCAWLMTPKGRGRRMTRNFAVRWLNRVEVPMVLQLENKPKTNQI